MPIYRPEGRYKPFATPAAAAAAGFKWKVEPHPTYGTVAIDVTDPAQTPHVWHEQAGAWVPAPQLAGKVPGAAGLVRYLPWVVLGGAVLWLVLRRK